MKINEIAKKILHLRETRMTGFIMAGVLREELGFEGYGEALRRRWIEADMEQSGMVTISNNLGVIEDIRQLAAECKDKCGTCGKVSCSCEGRCDSCNGDKCTCESQESTQESLAETAHFFAQAHAFRRNVSEVVGANDGTGADPSAAPEEWDEDMSAFYDERLPDLRNHWDTIHRNAPLDQTGRDKAWSEFEPGVKQHIHRTMFHPEGSGYPAYQNWRDQRRKEATRPLPRPFPRPGEGVEIGVNDSLVTAFKDYINEVATLGLGRTGDAPDVPVPGLGAGSAQRTQQAPVQAQSQSNPSRPQTVAIGNDVTVVEGGKQYTGKVSRMLPDGKYEISFAGDQPPARRAYDKTEVSTAAAPAAAR